MKPPKWKLRPENAGEVLLLIGLAIIFLSTVGRSFLA
jgi:hypothetical protein